MTLSRGARLCEHIIRRSRPMRGGLRRCGRNYLAARLNCSPRTVSRFVRELRDAGHVEVVRPRRQLTAAGWRTVECNGYRIRHRASSHRGDTGVTPLPKGSRAAAHTTPSPPQFKAKHTADAGASTVDHAAWRDFIRAEMADRRHKGGKAQ